MAELAARQHGVVARRQLAALGLGRGAIERRLRTGRLHHLHHGVYAVGHTALPPRGRMMAAVLACGPGAALSHRSAAALWGLLDSARARVEVTVPSSGARARPGIDVHRSRRLDPRDRTTVDGVPVTTVPRTLLDLAAVVRPDRLRRAFEEGDRLRLVDRRALDELLARSAGRCGVRPLRALLADSAVLEAPTRSELERRFLRLCRRHGLPPPLVNARVAGLEVDALWPAQRLVVELDGHAFHASRAAFERDRVRDAALQQAGYRVVRVTHRRLERDRLAVAATVRALLGTA